MARLRDAAPGNAIAPLAARTREEIERDVEMVRSQAERAAAQAAATRIEEQRARDLAQAEAARLEAVIADQGEAAGEADRAAELERQVQQATLDNQRQAAALEARRKELEADPVANAAIVFNDAREFGRQAWILELTGGGAAVVKLGTGRRQDLGAGTGAGTPLARWLKGLDGRRDHALILVRPSGVNRVDDVLAALAEVGIPFGLDLIGEDQVVRDGEAEAAAGGGGG